MKRMITGLALAFATSVSSAAVIVDQIGDEDGFGLGVTNGSSFYWGDVGSGDGDGTDVWMYGDATFSHTYDISGLGPITSASLEIFTGGQGLGGLTSISIDGSYIGDLTDGDDAGPGYNYAWEDTFDLMPFASLLDGADTLTVDVLQSGDGWVLDYSRLTISDDGATSSVPEPGSLAMLGLGLAGLGFARKKRA